MKNNIEHQDYKLTLDSETDVIHICVSSGIDRLELAGKYAIFENKYRQPTKHKFLKSKKKKRFCSPSHDNEEVQPVPGVSQVTATPKDPEGHHLYDHLQCKEDVDECIEGLWRYKVTKVTQG